MPKFDRNWGLIQYMMGKPPPADREGSTPAAATPQPPTSEERLQPVVEAGEGLAEAGQEDIAGQEDVNAANRRAAMEERARQSRGQAAVGHQLQRADIGAQMGLEAVQAKIETTRDAVDQMPENVKTEFDRQQTKLDATSAASYTGIAGQRGEALAGVMEGRGAAMDAAVSSIHGATQQQMADIDAQVQQGALSPSQATAMKAKIKMGASMQLSAAVGQTAHAFTQTQAQVATSFGQMFTSFSQTAQQTQGQFGAAAAGTFAQAEQAKGQFNVALTQLDAQATAHRDTMLSQNAATRATFQNNNDVQNTAMLDYTQDSWVMRTPVAINNFEAQSRIAHDFLKSDAGNQMRELMKDNMELARQGSMWQTLFGVLQLF